MRKSRISAVKKTIIIVAIIALLICIPYIYFFSRISSDLLAGEIEYTAEYFADIASMGRLHVLDSVREMTAQTYNIGRSLSKGESAERAFEYLSADTEADAGLVFKSDGSLIYGGADYGSLFSETAKEAINSGGNSVSGMVECDDGIKRFAIASVYAAPEGGTDAVMLLFPQSALNKKLQNLNLNNDGRICILDSAGNFVARMNSAPPWVENGQYTLDKTGDIKDTLLTVSSLKDGKKYLAYEKAAGIYDWVVVFSVPIEQTDIMLDADIVKINIFAASAILFMLALCVFCIYREDVRSRRMKLFKKKFRIATSQSARAAFEYDRRKDRLRFISQSEHISLPKPYLSLTELGALVHPNDRAAYMQSVSELRKNGTTSTTVRLFNFGGKESYRWYHVTGTRLTNRGEGKALTIGTVEDIDEREKERLVLYEKSSRDSLTGLCNRAETEKTVNERLSRLEDKERSVFAIIDLDDFKNINDEFGHDCGDKALVRFSEILKSTFRFGDVLGRLGGDEFVVYMTLTSEIEVVERRLRELKDSMLNKLGADEDSLPEITCSIGCCIARKGDNFESIYKRADAAMYESKLRGKGQFTIVD